MVDNETETFLDQQDYQDQLDVQEDIQDFQEEQNIEDYANTGDIPYKRKPDSLFSLFQRVWKSDDSSKVANLDKYELGKPDVTVRDAQYLYLLGRTLKHNKFAAFYKRKGEITLATSASKKGWFTELFVSQKKFTTRTSGSEAQPSKKKWSLFSPQSLESGESQ